ncbi:conserved protein of unknown function [Nitratireductor aquimarinus]|uniref:hypothetical protein n=1 Tax=Nitratireductor aquimarinus TaxID=889300 RepID=UPI003B5A694D
MRDDNDTEKPGRHSAGSARATGSEGTRGFVLGAVGAAIIILVIMAFSGTGFFGGEDAPPAEDAGVVPMGDGG